MAALVVPSNLNSCKVRQGLRCSNCVALTLNISAPVTVCLDIPNRSRHTWGNHVFEEVALDPAGLHLTVGCQSVITLLRTCNVSALGHDNIIPIGLVTPSQEWYTKPDLWIRYSLLDGYAYTGVKFLIQNLSPSSL